MIEAMTEIEVETEMVEGGKRNVGSNSTMTLPFSRLTQGVLCMIGSTRLLIGCSTSGILGRRSRPWISLIVASSLNRNLVITMRSLSPRNTNLRLQRSEAKTCLVSYLVTVAWIIII